MLSYLWSHSGQSQSSLVCVKTKLSLCEQTEKINKANWKVAQSEIIKMSFMLEQFLSLLGLLLSCCQSPKRANAASYSNSVSYCVHFKGHLRSGLKTNIDDFSM